MTIRVLRAGRVLKLSQAEFGAAPDPNPKVVLPIARHQGLLALLPLGITEAEIRSRIGAIEDAIERETLRIRFEQPDWPFDGLFIAWLGETFALTAAQIGGLFETGRGL